MVIRFALLARGRTGAMYAHDLARASNACLSTIYNPVVAAAAPLHGCRVAESPGAGHHQIARPRHDAFDDGYRALVLTEAVLASAGSGWTVKVEATG